MRVGHRGAALLAPENTLSSFRAAVACGVDAVEFDVLDLGGGALVVAHSHDLAEITHGSVQGSARGLSLAQVRAIAPELPTLDDALGFFLEEAPGVGLHVDLKLRAGAPELARRVAALGLTDRTVVSSTHVPTLRALAGAVPGLATAFTYPEDRRGISSRPRLAPAVEAGLRWVRVAAPVRVPRLARAAGAVAVMLHHRVVTRAAVARLHRRGTAVVAWTVDEAADLERVVDAGVDGVISNDPRIFLATLTA